METRPGSRTPLNITRVRGGVVSTHPRRDYVATEEPMEIRLVTPRETRKLAVTMRTPGADFELATGFLFAEGVIRGKEDIHQISYCVDRDLDEAQQYNVVNVVLRHEIPDDLQQTLERHFMVSSACGVCGKANLDALAADGLQSLEDSVRVPIERILALPAALREAQKVFETTGGLHAAALFDLNGSLLALREDVGRHNALDKLIGWALLQNLLPLDQHIVLVSGRASFELLQKALSARIPLFCAISAPSSLAVDLARSFGLTLVAFLRDDNCNIYCGQQRITS